MKRRGNPRATAAAANALGRFGKLIVAVNPNRPPRVGAITDKFGGYKTGLIFEYVGPGHLDDWRAQAHFLNSFGARIPDSPEGGWPIWEMRLLCGIRMLRGESE